MISKTTLLGLWAALATAAIYVGEVHGESPIEIPGLYTQDIKYSTEEMDKFMEAMGFDDESKQMIHDDKQLMIDISKMEDESTKVTSWTITKIHNKKRWSLTFESGKEFEATLLDGRKIMSTVTVNIDEEKPTIHRVFKMDGFEATSHYEFCKEGFKLTMEAKDAKVELEYKREQIIAIG